MFYNIYYRKGGCKNFRWLQYLDSRFGNHSDFTKDNIQDIIPVLLEHGHCFIVQPKEEEAPVLFMPQNAIDAAFDLPQLI